MRQLLFQSVEGGHGNSSGLLLHFAHRYRIGFVKMCLNLRYILTKIIIIAFSVYSQTRFFASAKNFGHLSSLCLHSKKLFIVIFFCLIIHIHFQFVININVSNNTIYIDIIEFLRPLLQFIDGYDFFDSLFVSFFKNCHAA